MKTISQTEFRDKFRGQLIFANFHLRADVLNYLKKLRLKVTEEQKKIVDIFIENNKIACTENRAVCQDTGYVQVFISIGNDIHIPFDLNKCIQQIVRDVYQEFYLRQSLANPITRENTSTNTPACIDYEFIKGDFLEVSIMLKGGGSENVTKIGFLLPTAPRSEIEDFIVDAVKTTGAKACPPYIIGVGIGGNIEKAVYYSRKVLLEDININSNDFIEKELSQDILNVINKMPIGFQGLKFGQTAMAVKVKLMPCHIATLPIAVSISCNAVRQGQFTI